MDALYLPGDRVYAIWMGTGSVVERPWWWRLLHHRSDVPVRFDGDDRVVGLEPYRLVHIDDE